jgi:hypothetical protein
MLPHIIRRLRPQVNRSNVAERSWLTAGHLFTSPTTRYRMGANKRPECQTGGFAFAFALGFAFGRTSTRVAVISVPSAR